MHASGHETLHGGMHAYHSSLLDSARHTLNYGVGVVMDRHWPSEYVYGSILRINHPGHQGYDVIGMINAVESLNPIYIFCDSINGFKRHFELHQVSDHRYDPDTYLKVVSEYRAIKMQLCRLAVSGHRHEIIGYSIEANGADLEKFCQEMHI